MKKINLDEVLKGKTSYQLNDKSSFIKKFIYTILKKVLYINRINNFIDKNEHLSTKHFIMELFEYLNFSFLISNSDLQKIPSEGRVICVANHPIGSLDSLVILKAFLDVRNNVKIVANDVLSQLDFLKDHILPVDLYNPTLQRKNISMINRALEEENAVIVFPAAEVSRLKWFKIKDSKWRNGAIHYAQKYNSPILPIFIEAKNSWLFYFVSLFSRKVSMILLAHELFNKKDKTIRLIIGDLIPAKVFAPANVNISYQTKLLKKHVYHIGKNSKKVFITEKNVIHPTDKKILKREVNNSEFIGLTKESMKIFSTTRNESPHIINEIARLREMTFRKVGEGTGKKLDLDKYDSYYSHLIVWDDIELEIVGSYRIGIGSKILAESGTSGFYTSTLFNFEPAFIENILPNSIELGRSFVQEKYWNTHVLDYLWQGIGNFLIKNEDVKYMFGGVSISANYPNHVTALMVYYFNKWFSSDKLLAASKMKFALNEKQIEEYSQLFFGENAKDDFKILKKMLHLFGYSVPILYKHYSDLCSDNGVSFLDFGIDPDFKNCVDGLILIDVDKIKEEKRQRYLRPTIQKELIVA